MARAAARAQREAEAANRRRVREQVRNERELLRLRQQQGKFARQDYLTARQLEADKLNLELEGQISFLRSILSGRLTSRQETIWASIAPRFEPPALLIPPELNG